MHTPASQKNLVIWLVTQERVIRLWIDEVLSTAPPSTDLVDSLEKHHRWLVQQIGELTRHKKRPKNL